MAEDLQVFKYQYKHYKACNAVPIFSPARFCVFCKIGLGSNDCQADGIRHAMPFQFLAQSKFALFANLGWVRMIERTI
jgi:hypothetical protein